MDHQIFWWFWSHEWVNTLVKTFHQWQSSSKKLLLSVRTFVTVFSQTWILSSNINFLFFCFDVDISRLHFLFWIWFLITIFVWQWKKNYVNVLDGIKKGLVNSKVHYLRQAIWSRFFLKLYQCMENEKRKKSTMT